MDPQVVEWEDLLRRWYGATVCEEDPATAATEYAIQKGAGSGSAR